MTEAKMSDEIVLGHLYLAAHICRGEVTFDVVVAHGHGNGLASDPFPWFIMPSTGHRVKPFWTYSVQRLTELAVEARPEGFWPDFFAINDRPPQAASVQRKAPRTRTTIEDLA